MYYLYVIQSNQHNRQYIGTAANVAQRLAQHNAGKVRSTRTYRPYQLAYTETFATRGEARKREVQIKKSGKLRSMLKTYGAIV